MSDADNPAAQDWIVPSWSAPADVAGLVTTRRGGASSGAYASLNLGFATSRRASADDPAAIAVNRQRLLARLPSPPVWLDQVHGTAVIAVDATNLAALRAQPPQADAAITRESDVVLAVLTADCLPVALASCDGSVLGIAHAGWRGLAQGVLDNTVSAMDVPADDIVAWLGPAIGPDAFEVGADVYAAFSDRDAGAALCFRSTAPGKWHADLYALARRRLRQLGVRSIEGGGFCTYSDAATFFSYRRDGETGRMATLLWRRGHAG